MTIKDSSLENFLTKAASFSEEIDKLKKKYRELNDAKERIVKNEHEFAESLFSSINALQVFSKDVISKMSDYPMQMQEKDAALAKTKQQLDAVSRELESLKKAETKKSSEPQPKTPVQSAPAPVKVEKASKDFDLFPEPKKEKSKKSAFDDDLDMDLDFKKSSKESFDDFEDFKPAKGKKSKDMDFDLDFDLDANKKKEAVKVDTLPSVKDKKGKGKDDEIYLFDL